MIGAVFTIVRIGDLGPGIMVPIICLVLLGVVAYQPIAGALRIRG